MTHSFRLALVFVALSAPLARAEPAVDFTRDIRPILAGKCFNCHGPDENARKAKLRLDTRAGALALARSKKAAVVPGKPERSELLARITSTDDTDRMPPIKGGKSLSSHEVDLLRRWIAQGAPYAGHWAYAKPVRVAPPMPRDALWVRNPIDRFILARLEKEGLRPTAAADRYTLIRRLSLDLTGLPPTPKDADQFVADTRPDAYERLVDRLLSSPAFGERWAQPWLDLARYADSQGYANDPDRTIWPWRDWVIRALNDNMPYDQFTLQQLAGDLLPNPTPSQLLATGFHRNTLTNTEGGTNPEEFRSAAMVDRVNTTFQVWLGTTMACAQCHNHKYDPITQKEYFQIYAILNNCEDRNSGDDFPTLTLPAEPAAAAEIAALNARLPNARKELMAETKKVDDAQTEWEKTVDRKKLPKDVAAALDGPMGKRDAKTALRVQVYHRLLSEPWKKINTEVNSGTERLKLLSVTSPILREGKPRVTHIQMRGNFQDLGEKVSPGLPAALSASLGKGPVDRLALARWIVSPDNPLTARVAVNRLWEELFGIGIVETSEDFGTQGQMPTHPELLDYLALEYQRFGWDTKAMIRLLVTSAAYRQGSQVTPALTERDPQNRLLARGPRIRASAENVRDQSLFVSGLLSPKMFGPPVQPPRPNFGLSAAFGSATDWRTSNGEDRYRRALYTRWRRNAPYPSMTTFDAPERTSCNVRRLRTNTPLQALVTLNDPVYVEAAQALARRTVAEGGTTTAERVTRAFRLVLTRPPTERESARLVALFEKARSEFLNEATRATAMATKPLGPAPQGANVAELAAWTVVANVLLNLDETLARR
jgi:Protein of unknown function (DUF1553)/Protein of unknown function (DUF1549)/Planctomycete cytochrome C